MALAQTFVTNLKNKMETLTFPVTLNTNSTVASIKLFAPNVSGIYFFSKTDGQTITTYAASPGFTASDLNDTSAPGTFGCIIQVKDAAATQTAGALGVELVPAALVAGSTGLSALATVALKGASSSGVTSEGYLSFIFNMTGVDPDASTSTATFLMRVTYQKA